MILNGKAGDQNTLVAGLVVSDKIYREHFAATRQNFLSLNKITGNGPDTSIGLPPKPGWGMNSPDGFGRQPNRVSDTSSASQKPSGWQACDDLPCRTFFYF
ncbi:hypothetical protein WCLP8_5020001 [uncultured Gammaproteobacteria bacterium]